MCAMSASGCSSLVVLELLLDFSRAQSVLDFIEVDVRFALRGFAERDDADFMFTLRMNDRNGNPGEQAERHEALLAVGERSSSKV
jgi:hypothetical protein